MFNNYILDEYTALRSALADLKLPPQLLHGLVGVSHSYPGLILHFSSLLVTCGGADGINEWMKWLV